MRRIAPQSGESVKILGLMSGTSLDGLDVVLVRWTGESLDAFEVLECETYPYDQSLQKTLLRSINGSTAQVCDVNFRLGHYWADSVHQFLETHGLTPEEITCIGSHGQTLWHESGKSTLQVGEPAVISTRTGIPVVSNFREHDIAAGGTGAPLIPFLDWLLFRKLAGNTVVLNIGGIGNITCIQEGMEQEEVRGWDTGPGNMVVNTLIQWMTNGKQSYDTDGELAKRGEVNRELLRELMDDPFVNHPPPKSTGREYYSEEFVRGHFPLGTAETIGEKAELIATASEWTVASVTFNVEQFWISHNEIDRVIVGGGGVHNLFFMDRLDYYFPNADIVKSSEFDIPVDAKEAVGFAVFARAYLMNHPANLPGVTGADRPVVLGKLTI